MMSSRAGDMAGHGAFPGRGIACGEPISALLERPARLMTQYRRFVEEMRPCILQGAGGGDDLPPLIECQLIRASVERIIE